MKVLGVIPARGGSKGIPKKNLFPIAGQPLIAWSILEAKKSARISDLIVSTDSEEIATVAKKAGAHVPFIRPAEHATDRALSVDVMKHAIEEMEKLKGYRYDVAILLQPTTPLRSALDIDRSIEVLQSAEWDSVVSMVDVGANHPARMYWIKENRLKSVLDEGIAMRPRQELEPIYIRSGDIYACRRDLIFKQGSMMAGNCYPLVIDPKRSVNIDNETDMKVAEYLLERTRH